MPIHPNARLRKPFAEWQRQFSLSLAATAGLAVSLEATVMGPGLVLPFTIAVLLAGTTLYAGFRMGARKRNLVPEHPHQGLVPKEVLKAAIESHLQSHPPQGRIGALIHCEMSGAAAIAAMQGLDVEERLITEAAARLTTLLPALAIAASAGRVSFLVFIPDSADPLVVAGLARAITGSLAAGIEVQGLRLACPSHSGIAFCPQDGSTAEDLIASAELALSVAREQQTPGYSFFDPQSAAATLRKRAVQRAVAAAHASGSLRLVYQPIHHMQTGELSGFEALMRMDDPELGPISPAEFIPAAEQAGLIAAVGDWALDEACRTAALWPPHLVVAVNLAPLQFLSGGIIQTIRGALERHGLPAYRLEVEITEGTLIKDSELVLGQIRILREMGVGVALDDFGTGYSSLGYLWRFPFSKLKIDRSFTAALEESSSAKGILRSIVKLGHSLGMTVTAEGIEGQRQLWLLRDLGCDLAQGYLLGRPAPPHELAAVIMRNFARQLERKQRGATGRTAAGTG